VPVVQLDTPGFGGLRQLRQVIVGRLTDAREPPFWRWSRRLALADLDFQIRVICANYAAGNGRSLTPMRVLLNVFCHDTHHHLDF
jgi:hypothetical protein